MVSENWLCRSLYCSTEHVAVSPSTAHVSHNIMRGAIIKRADIWYFLVLFRRRKPTKSFMPFPDLISPLKTCIAAEAKKQMNSPSLHLTHEFETSDHRIYKVGEYGLGKPLE